MATAGCARLALRFIHAARRVSWCHDLRRGRRAAVRRDAHQRARTLCQKQKGRLSAPFVASGHCHGWCLV